MTTNPFNEAYNFAKLVSNALPKLDEAAAKAGYKKTGKRSSVRKQTPQYQPTKTRSVSGRMRKSSSKKKMIKKKGKSKKMSKKVRMKKKIPGIVDTHEISGLVNDNDCVYIIHTALDPLEVIRKVAWEMVRKLLFRAGFIINSVDEVFDSSTGFSSVGFTLQVWGKNAETDTEIIRLTSVFGSADSIRIVGEQVMAVFIEYSSGYHSTIGAGNVNNAIELTKICLYDNKTSNSLAASVDLRQEVITMTGISKLKIQNRTLSGDGSASNDNVTNNPLQGRVYAFSGVPKPKAKNMSLFDGVPRDKGVQLIRASALGLDSNLREPPLARVFWNCYSSNDCMLNPGDVKQITLRQTKTANILKLLKMIRYQTGLLGADYKTYYSPFKHQMVAMEDVINVDAEEKITVAYEVNRAMYIHSTSKKANVVALAGYRQTSFNNVV